MKFHRAWLVVALGGVIALVFVTTFVSEPGPRVFLSMVAILPLLYVSLRLAREAEQQAAHERRKFMKLRTVTDEFIMNVRSLNRLSVIAQGENPPEDTSSMIDDVIEQMHGLVERMRDAAGEESLFPPTEDER
jgi:hypothetical protein